LKDKNRNIANIIIKHKWPFYTTIELNLNKDEPGRLDRSKSILIFDKNHHGSTTYSYESVFDIGKLEVFFAVKKGESGIAHG
jgi:hypothetical protein